MSNLFSTPETPQEDPATVALRKQQLEQSEAERVRSIQDTMASETQRRTQNLGTSSLFGGLRGRRSLTSLLGSG